MASAYPETLDHEHDAIFDCVHRLYQGSLFHPADRRIRDQLRRLAAELDAHFATERELMTRVDYPDVARHEAEHEEIVRLLNRLAELPDDADIGVLRTEIPLLVQLVLAHKLREDRRLEEHLRAHPAPPPRLALH